MTAFLRSSLRASLAFVCLAAPAYADEVPTPRLRPQVVTVRDDPGGNVAAYAARVDAVERRRQRVELRGTYCGSSCTMWLALSEEGRLCADPGLRFYFHMPFAAPNAKDILAEYGIIGADADQYLAYATWEGLVIMVSHWPAAVAVRVLPDLDMHDSGNFLYIDASDLVPTCEPEAMS